MKYLLVGIALLSSFANAAFGVDADKSWRLATDDTAVVVTVQQGMPVVTRVGPAKGDMNWLLGPTTEALMPSVMQQGTATPTKWQYADGSFDSQSGELTLRFTNASPSLELKSIWRARPGRGPVEHWLTLANNSGGVITVGAQDSLALSHVAVPTGESMDAWWIRRGAGNATDEGGTFIRSVGRNTGDSIVSDPNDGASPVPWVSFQVGTSRGIYVGWEFSGQGRIRWHNVASDGMTAEASPTQLGIEVGNLPAFKTDVMAGETFLVPPAFVGVYSGDIDDGSYSLHRFIMEKLLPKFPKGYDYPTLAYNFYLDGGGPNSDEKSVMRSAAFAHDIGFETFVADAMWFPTSGAWFWDPKRFPNGPKPLEEYLHSHDMQFGLWMAYTHGSNSDDPRAMSISKHPDWFSETPKLDPAGQINWDAQIDLGYDPARDWAEQSTQRVVSEYKLDYFKTDYTPIVTKCVQTNHRHHYGTDVSYWSTLGYYAVQEGLMQKYPNLILEGCSGSGHIKDFGDIQRVHMIAMNDTLSALPNRQGTYDSTFAFPPAALMNYTYENYYNMVPDAPEAYFWRSSMMNQWQIDPTHSEGWTAEQKASAKKATDIYKSWVRPILHDVQVHHILPRPDGYHWDGMFYWSPNLKRGTVYIFRPNSDQKSMLVPLKGLDASTKYKLRTEDHSTPDATYSGADLMNKGLTIQLPGKFTSDLIYLEEAH